MGDDEKCAIACKVVLIGESGVGKTSIIAQFTSGKFDPDTVTSLSAQYVSKTIEFHNLQKAIKFDIWDTAGQEKYRALAKIFYKDAKVICLVYDITSEKTFNEIKTYWYEMVKSHADPDVLIAVVANKSDLYDNAEVKNEEGEEFAKSIGALFQSTSAKSDTGITNLFDNIGQKYFNPNFDATSLDKQQQEEYQKKKTEEKQKKKKPQNIQLTAETVNEPKKKKCC
jgi:small GTP-binding protein